jgi:hypothetical protein
VRALGLALAVSLGASPAAADVSVRWLGIAGFTLTGGETTIAEDPFLSRPGIFDTLFRLYVPDEAVLSRFLGPDSPAPELARAKLYLVGHSHYDHLGDVPWLASRTQGRVVGSATTSAIARGYGLRPTGAIIAARARREKGPFEVRVFASQHAKGLLRVPFEAGYRPPPETPLHAFSFVLGDARVPRHRALTGSTSLLSTYGLRACRRSPRLGKEAARRWMLRAATAAATSDYARRPRGAAPAARRAPSLDGLEFTPTTTRQPAPADDRPPASSRSAAAAAGRRGRDPPADAVRELQSAAGRRDPRLL